MAGSKVLDAAEKGSFCGFFTKGGYSCSIYPALNIYKIKWSFFKINDKSAAFDIFMEIPTFLTLTRAIKDGSLKQRIAAECKEKAQYPGAWKSGPMGANGANNINIGANNKGDGITLQGKTNGKNAFIPISSYGELEDLAYISDAVIKLYGKNPDPTVYGWYRDRAERIIKAASQYRHEDKEEETVTEQPDSIPKQTENKTTQPVEEPKEQSAGEKKSIKMQTLGPVKKQGNVWYLPVKADGKQYTLCFKDGVFCSNWDAFKEQAPKGIELELNCINQGDQLWYAGASA